MRRYRYRRQEVWKGVLAGALGGLAGAWVMNQYWVGVSKAERELSAKFSSNGHGQKQGAGLSPSQEQAEDEDSGDATQKAANKLFKLFFGRSLTAEEKKAARGREAVLALDLLALSSLAVMKLLCLLLAWPDGQKVSRSCQNTPRPGGPISRLAQLPSLSDERFDQSGSRQAINQAHEGSL